MYGIFFYIWLILWGKYWQIYHSHGSYGVFVDLFILTLPSPHLFWESLKPRNLSFRLGEECRGGSAACWHGRVQGVPKKTLSTLLHGNLWRALFPPNATFVQEIKVWKKGWWLIIPWEGLSSWGEWWHWGGIPWNSHDCLRCDSIFPCFKARKDIGPPLYVYIPLFRKEIVCQMFQGLQGGHRIQFLMGI